VRAMNGDGLRYAFAGDRDVAVDVLDFMLDGGHPPLALLLPEGASHGAELRRRCADLDPARVLVGDAFCGPEGLRILGELELDYIICVHFPRPVPDEVLRTAGVGVLNLHPALLPHNRGWHCPSWAILEGTPYGATLHFITEQLDAGDVIHQRELEVAPGDTADSLYARAKHLELDVFREAFPSLLTGAPPRRPQDISSGTFHRRSELLGPDVREIQADRRTSAGELIDRLRALTTDRIDEAAVLVRNGERLRVQVRIVPEREPDSPGA
jgi:methionyl-tRNA formyltransferase